MDSELPKPTAGEAMFFFAIVKHTKNRADIDWTAVAEEQGFKNAEVAKVRFGQVKRKLGISTEGTSPASRTTTPKKAAGPKTPSKATKVPKTPAGRVGSKGKGAKKTKGENDNDEQDNNAERDTTAKKEEEAQDTDVGVLPEYEAMAGLPDPF